jgi:cell division protein FtsW
VNRIYKYLHGDRPIWTMVLLLALWSILLVYSSVVTLAYKYHGGNAIFYVFKHALFVGTGFGLIYIIHRINYRYFSRIAQLLIWIVIPLLALTLLLGVNVNNASRWLTIPFINQSFQTSDLAKLALIMFVARTLAQKKDDLKDFSGTFVPMMGVVLLVIGLILPANLSTAVVLLATSLLLMFMAGVKVKHLLTLVPLAISAIAIIIILAKTSPDFFPRFETWNNRIENFISGEGNSDGNYQTDQAKIAIATGGFMGKGPGNSTQRNFLPSSYSDFIYAIIVEEYGFLGGLVIILLYMALLYRSLRIVQQVKGSFAAYLVLGLSFSLVIQGMINMGVNVGLLPVTGQTLPLISNGGTSFWFTSISLGIILSVSRSIQEEEKVESLKQNRYVQA